MFTVRSISKSSKLVQGGLMDDRVSTNGRLFLAAVPDAHTAARIHRLAGTLKRAHKFMGTLIPPERLHVSLFFLGGLHEAGVRSICETAAEMTLTPFDVSFDRTASFGGKRANHPFVLFGAGGLSALKSFRQTFAEAMTRKGLRRWANTNFTPHLTLLYGDRRVEEYPIHPIGWTVSELVLIRSMHGHVRVAEWPLSGPESH
jgi:RNA 2',3'-cyclic 3'-phosphodiesterase